MDQFEKPSFSLCIVLKKVIAELIVIFYSQLKMRTGGVDPGRIGKRKKSPKPRSKRSHGSGQSAEVSQAQPTIAETVENVDASNGDATQVEATTEVENSTFEHIAPERLSTTPGCGLDDENYDVEKAFKVNI